jgi:hypothetical protein
MPFGPPERRAIAWSSYPPAAAPAVSPSVKINSANRANAPCAEARDSTKRRFGLSDRRYEQTVL